jgi:hypothetical protein
MFFQLRKRGPGEGTEKEQRRIREARKEQGKGSGKRRQAGRSVRRSTESGGVQSQAKCRKGKRPGAAFAVPGLFLKGVPESERKVLKKPL